VAAAAAAAHDDLLQTIESCVSACGVARITFNFLFYAIVRPRQLVGLVADSYPHFVRPVLIADVLDNEEAEAHLA
jgi:hypothetical protein